MPDDIEIVRPPEVFTRVPTPLFIEHRDDEERGFYEL
jgi:hypothetical protein